MTREQVIAVALKAMPPLSGVHFAMVGTAAMLLHGQAIVPADVDFLCAKVPDLTADVTWDCFLLEPATGSTEGSARVEIDGIKVDYIFADEKRVAFLSDVPQVIDGVPCATLDDVIGLKRFADREKDRDALAKL